MRADIDKFVNAFGKSLCANTFIKLTLSNYKGTEPHLQRVAIRLVDLKKCRRLMFQYRYNTRDIVKNFKFDEGGAEVERLLTSGFRSGHLFTTDADIQLTIGKKSSRLTTGKPSAIAKTEGSHNREKKTLIDPNAFYLKALGISTDDGKIRADARDKWKQINKFVETLAGLIENSSLKDNADLRIIDMGSGKGYLTFALYDHLMQKYARSKGEMRVTAKGIEQRTELVSLCNDLAKAGGFDGLNFIQGTIADTTLGQVDVLIALHACDTATDDALFKAITVNAEIIVAAPCCHKEIKKQLKSPELLAGILKHPVMLERTAETITDGIRSMLLESKGYKTKMFEFVATAHTPKNNLLVATRTGAGGALHISAQVRELKKEFGIEHHHLDELLQKQRLAAT